MQPIQIRQGDDDARWDAYVAPLASTVTDLSAWRHVVFEADRVRSHFFAVEEGSRLVAALGLYEVRHPFFGRYLATAPFGNDGGLYFDNRRALELLLAEARQLADTLDVEYLVIRCRELELADFAADRRYCTAVIDLEGGVEAVWEKTLRAKTRNQVRRGIKEGFTVHRGHEQLSSFLDVFDRHMRDLGSPAHGLRFYESVLRHLGEQAEFVVVRDGERPVAGALVFNHNETATNYHAVALRSYNPRCPNYLIYWKMIEASCTQGLKRFDMGRSELTSSVLDFKKNWRPAIVPLVYNYYLRKISKPPFLDHDNPKYRLPIAVWRRLPLTLTKLLGPRLISGLA